MSTHNVDENFWKILGADPSCVFGMCAGLIPEFGLGSGPFRGRRSFPDIPPHRGFPELPRPGAVAPPLTVQLPDRPHHDASRRHSGPHSETIGGKTRLWWDEFSGSGVRPDLITTPEREGGKVPIHREIIRTIGDLIPIARDVGLIPPRRDAGPAPRQPDRAPLPERGSPTRDIPTLPGGFTPAGFQTAGLEQLPLVGGFFGSEMVPRAPGGVYMGGGFEGAFHTTLLGNRRTNKVTLVADPMSGKLAFLVDAGTPSGWSKITIKKRHHHGYPRHHHHP